MLLVHCLTCQANFEPLLVLAGGGTHVVRDGLLLRERDVTALRRRLLSPNDAAVLTLASISLL